MSEARTQTFRRRHRLTHNREFQAVGASGVRKQRGGLVVSVLPNTLEHSRLGLSVGVRVGPATVRNRCKRVIREAFRLEREALPKSATGGYDIVVGVRAPRAEKSAPVQTGKTRRKNAIPALEVVRGILVELVMQADHDWRRRQRRAGGADGAAEAGGT